MTTEFFSNNPHGAEDLEVGQELGPAKDIITTEMVQMFCRTWGTDLASRFTDSKTARTEGHAGPILPGILIMAVVEKGIRSWAPNAQLLRLETLFRRPVAHNEPIHVLGIVSAKTEGRGVMKVSLDVQLQNKRADTLVAGEATLLFHTAQ